MIVVWVGVLALIGVVYGDKNCTYAGPAPVICGEGQVDKMKTLVAVESFISMFCSIAFMVFLGWRTGVGGQMSVRKEPRTMILSALAFGDFLMALSMITSILSDKENDSACKAAGFLLQTADVFLALQMAHLASLVYHLSCTSDATAAKDSSKDTFPFPLGTLIVIGINFTVALAMAFFPLFEAKCAHYMRSNIGTCWIAAHPTAARYVLFYIWEWLIIAVVIVLYVCAFCAAYRKNSTAKGADFMDVLRYSFYPGVMLVVWIPSSVNRVMESAGHYSCVAAWFQAIVFPLWGCGDFLVFMATNWKNRAVKSFFANKMGARIGGIVHWADA
ncbi:hypothetical protein Pelo_11475 [Pelomyxa schiedti]|nr:hypothetical protein Pelo_11475 [Pelomyxa schiedti]